MRPKLFAIHKHHQLTGLHFVPAFVVGQWLGGDDRHHVIGGGFTGKVDGDIGVGEARLTKGSATGNPLQLGAAESQHPAAVAEQAVEYTHALQLLAARVEKIPQGIRVG